MEFHPKNNPILSLAIVMITALGTSGANWSEAKDMEEKLETVQDVVKEQAVVKTEIKNLTKQQDNFALEQKAQTLLINQILLKLH